MQATFVVMTTSRDAPSVVVQASPNLNLQKAEKSVLRLTIDMVYFNSYLFDLSSYV